MTTRASDDLPIEREKGPSKGRYLVRLAGAVAALDEAALIAHCRDHIGGYKIPRRYAFVDAMPKNAMGKILRRSCGRLWQAEVVNVSRESRWQG